MDVDTHLGTSSSSMSSSATMSMPTSTSTTAAMSMSMGDSGGSNGEQMLLNWNTIDACFLSSDLHIRTAFTFFLTCLASFLLVISLEFLRRLQRRFDQYLRTKNAFLRDKEYVIPEEMEEQLVHKGNGAASSTSVSKERMTVVVIEQTLRGLMHASQFALSYYMILLFMYSNGYIIISILLRALVGFACFTRDTLYSSADARVLLP
ncbi:hypothetical protein G7Y89_g14468 [Cudoniella acicularis]|uniref:Copper transport protein n=1 Tax=Cudoniella acicularis TaxID=354080 RepID=A0A8H4R532_9HELO|nr:hypothetical protein G7Y89_g14468 [Cudoniella acicularis]